MLPPHHPLRNRIPPPYLLLKLNHLPLIFPLFVHEALLLLLQPLLDPLLVLDDPVERAARLLALGLALTLLPGVEQSLHFEYFPGGRGERQRTQIDDR